MRNESEVLRQIHQFCHAHDSIRAAVMNGSRVNPNAPRDPFNDYDVALYVTDPGRFLRDQTWITTFGELIILQQNDFIDHGREGHIFLMLFSDGVRIDLGFNPLDNSHFVSEDSLALVLLDKDGRIPPLSPPSDAGYYIQRPTRKVFDETVNEVFWCSQNIAKGLWRGELAYAKYMFDEIVRPCLVRMLEWYAAMQHDWAIGTGSYGKWLEKFLPPNVWTDYACTYAGAGEEDNWDALFLALRLARRIGVELADHLGYTYPMEDDRRMVDTWKACGRCQSEENKGRRERKGLRHKLAHP